MRRVQRDTPVWIVGAVGTWYRVLMDDAQYDDARVARAHQRLLREFLEEHLADGRALRAFAAWERLDA